MLNFLRDGTVPLPESTRELEEVLKEAQYYRLLGLVQHCLTTLQVRGSTGACFYLYHQCWSKVARVYRKAECFFELRKVFDSCLNVDLSLTNGLLDVDAETQGCLQGMSHSYDHFSQRGTEYDSHL